MPDWRVPVVPNCRPGQCDMLLRAISCRTGLATGHSASLDQPSGYIDVTDGMAYIWECASWCDGGANLRGARGVDGDCPTTHDMVRLRPWKNLEALKLITAAFGWVVRT